MLVTTQNLQHYTIWSVIVRSCNVRPPVIRGPFLSGLAFSVDDVHVSNGIQGRHMFRSTMNNLHTPLNELE